LDNFREEVAAKQNKTLDLLLYGLSWIVMILCAIIAMSNLYAIVGGYFQLAPIIATLVCGGLAALIWFKKDELRVEYDYTFTNGDLDVGKVFGNSRRKLMTSLAMKNVESAGAVTDKSFQRFLNNKDVKKHNWFVNREAHLYYFYFTKNEVRHAIVLELSKDMITMIKPYLGFGVWQGE
jgi:hypothetical protein